jgi:hypothetical protein
MKYYIILPGDLESKLSDANLIGESSFNNFWSGGGLKVLMNILDKRPEMIPTVSIVTDQNKIISIEQFLTDIRNLNIR